MGTEMARYPFVNGWDGMQSLCDTRGACLPSDVLPPRVGPVNEAVLTLPHLSRRDNNMDDMLDAFMALGGSSEKEAAVPKDEVFNMLKRDFGLNVDVRNACLACEPWR